MSVGLFICASVGLIFTALVAGVIILINKAAPEIDPTEYGWVLLDDAAYNVIAYTKKEYVLRYVEEVPGWEMYNLFKDQEIYGPEIKGDLTHQFMELLDNYIETYNDYDHD